MEAHYPAVFRQFRTGHEIHREVGYRLALERTDPAIREIFQVTAVVGGHGSVFLLALPAQVVGNVFAKPIEQVAVQVRVDAQHGAMAANPPAPLLQPVAAHAYLARCMVEQVAQGPGHHHVQVHDQGRSVDICLARLHDRDLAPRPTAFSRGHGRDHGILEGNNRQRIGLHLFANAFGMFGIADETERPVHVAFHARIEPVHIIWRKLHAPFDAGNRHRGLFAAGAAFARFAPTRLDLAALSHRKFLYLPLGFVARFLTTGKGSNKARNRPSGRSGMTCCPNSTKAGSKSVHIGPYPRQETVPSLVIAPSETLLCRSGQATGCQP